MGSHLGAQSLSRGYKTNQWILENEICIASHSLYILVFKHITHSELLFYQRSAILHITAQCASPLIEQTLHR